MKQNFILVIETTTDHLGLAVLNKDGVALATYSEMAFRHLSDHLHPAIKQVMQEANVEFNQLCAIGCTRGPGSFTSVRVGLAAAKGLAFALNIPVVTLTSLEALALQYSKENTLKTTLHVWVEANSGHVYAQEFNVKGAISKPVCAPVVELIKNVKTGDIIIGTGAEKHAEVAKEHTEKQILKHINPTHLGQLCLERLKTQTSDVNNTAPLYVQALHYDKTYKKDGTKL